MPTKWYDGTVTRIEEQTPTTKRFWVEIPEVESFDFQAGQFVTMDLPVHEKRLHRWRSYSIASAPDGGNVLEFCIVYLDGGLATRYFFEEVKVGTALRFKGPDGTFTLPQDLDSKLVLVCTGTGVAPFRSMLWDIHNRKLPFKSIHLIFGTRHQDGILYRDEFEAFQKEWPNFKYDIALSRESGWEGYKGYVHQIYQEQYTKPEPDLHFYLCGWSNMIDDAVANLIVGKGFDKSQIHYELYG
ncbi:MAG: FAD-dependent oxidoreductase [Saprospirales bacterium]|nr:FAD-dependent oxidoreductase [Saprospirales bacterium]MBK8490110.1 FAD-dependent oxidoreductase [Saprospirales bacterium]